jgi:hypothetical protein
LALHPAPIELAATTAGFPAKTVVKSADLTLVPRFRSVIIVKIGAKTPLFRFLISPGSAILGQDRIV